MNGWLSDCGSFFDAGSLLCATVLTLVTTPADVTSPWWRYAFDKC
jgi:hypothetical protein